LLNVHIIERKKMMTRRIRRRATIRIRSSSRRSLIGKLTLDKNGNQVMRALNQEVMTWQS
jgi:hypothetical protein